MRGYPVEGRVSRKCLISQFPSQGVVKGLAAPWTVFVIVADIFL